jgi:hypothetical protein
MKYSLAVLGAALVALSVSLHAWSAPKVDNVVRTWELEIDLEQPQAIQLTIPGEKEPQTFWFIRYTVTNHTDEDRVFVPDFVLYTDTGETIRAQKDVPPAVFTAIKETYNDPLLRDETSMTGKLLQGEDNAKKGVAVFRNFDPKAGAIDVFVGNLTGEKMEVDLPQPITTIEVDRKGNKVEVTKDKIVLSKTLDLKYAFPKDPSARKADKLTLSGQTWVLR